MADNHNMASIVLNIFRQRLLLCLLLMTLIVPILIPLRSYLFVLPEFSEKLLRYMEEEAHKTANHLSSHLIVIRDGEVSMPDAFNQNLTLVKRQFDLEKVKIFAGSGQVLFSTDASDIGTMNRRDYFHQTVAKGDIYSTIVPKSSQTLEGRTTTRDIAEIYVPIMFDGTFIGAFELYYDLTHRKEQLDGMLRDEAALGGAISFTLFCIIGFMIYLTSKALVDQRNAENKLRLLNANLEIIVEEKTREISTTQLTSIKAVAILAEKYDLDTGEHLNRIRAYTRLLTSELARQSAYSGYLKKKENYVEEIAIASLLHDIGKTSIPNEILTKPGKLTATEFERIKSHTTIAGEALLQGNQVFVDTFGKDSYLALAADIALYHHEKWDGTGYPDGLKGKDIPLSARIVAVADVYDALRSRRPYKTPWPHEQAVAFILSEAGKQFDPVLTRAFANVAGRFRDIASTCVPEETLRTDSAAFAGETEPLPSAGRSCSGRLIALGGTGQDPHQPAVEH